MRQIDFEHGGIAQNILKAALPMLVAQVLNLLYNIVDRIYIARIPDIGTAALGAVGLCFPIIVITTAFSNLFGSGGAPLFAIARGSGDKARAGLILNLACTLLLCCAGVLMVIGLLFARPILVLFGASPEALQYALPYLMLYLLGTYPSMLTTGLNPFINAQGYATAGMLSVVIGAAANLVLDPVFIFVLGMGIRGAAAATVGVVLPSFVIILLIAAALHSLMKYAGVNAFLAGVRPCVVAMILATACTMGLSTLGGFTTVSGGFAPDMRALAVFALLGILHFAYKKKTQKAPSPIGMILLSAVLGAVLWSI